ncbi:Dolichyl-phosphate-mannose-protein mannosyltransferase [Kutzneria sp. CA-103260]|nr:Dolichyl-phosphate-mannose-protein mannosyltransferase [Kutzneria sp. CA-103260]
MAVVAVVLVRDCRYGYFVDELYFRLLGGHPAWGYVDQPPLTPLIAGASTSLFGDTLWALRMPAALAYAVLLALVWLIARELGGRPDTRLLAVIGAGLGPFTLSSATVLFTNAFDIPLWMAASLFVIRALRRSDGRWWLAAGATAGLATYNKYLIVLLVFGVLVGLVVVGPRRVFRDRWLWLAMALAVVVASPNLIYQAVTGFPQLTMAGALSGDLGDRYRGEFAFQQLLLVGPTLAPIWIAGFSWLFRQPALRSLPAAAVVCGAVVLITGGRPDYAFPLMLLLFVAGCVAIQHWLSRSAARRLLVGVAVGGNAAVAIVSCLAIVPLSVVGSTPLPGMDLIVMDSIGWPELAAQVQAVQRDHPGSIVIAGNYGETGALDRYDVPNVYSGYGPMHAWATPPEGTTTAVVIGVANSVLSKAFTNCIIVAHADNRHGVANPEQGKPIELCTGPRASWSTMWPLFENIAPYG